MPDLHALHKDVMSLSWEKLICMFISSIYLDMGHSEQNNTGIDKSYCNSFNATNAIMVQQIVRTCSGEPMIIESK